MQLWKTVYINTSYMLNSILFKNNHHFKDNTSYILNFILCEKNHHFKSIDIHYTSSPLFTLCTLLETVYICGKQYTLTLVTC
ncbi:unnamed protein product [Callosobruchus maculatus]|uniref:Uncharacterized protein n=2 Tax=Callosobruchus maculatus TaxID=64391 RepID=A0A653DPR3_CALMS|nr:unnamed protein product [Callosobruchus maculatus]